MTSEIRVPPIGDGLSEAKVIQWLKKPGDIVELNELLLELETDKVTIEVLAPVSGRLSSILGPSGSLVSPGMVLGFVSETDIEFGDSGPKASPNSDEIAEANNRYDVVVIGSGPGGYVCAIRAAQLGLKVAIIEKNKTHGGTCLNVGCIPSKALLHASELYEQAIHRFADMGMKASVELDLPRMLAFKDRGVKGNVDGVAFLLKKNKIVSVHGTGRIAGPGKVEVSASSGDSHILETRSIVIATGADAASVPGINVDEREIVSSTGALSLSEVPDRLLVVGAGVIGPELGSVWRRLGSRVTVVDILDRILPGMDGEVSKSLERIFAKQGLEFFLGTRIVAADRTGVGFAVKLAGLDGTDRGSVGADVILVAIGRVPCTDGLGLDEIGVKRDEKKRILINAQFETTVPNIFAIGDVVAGPMLAHKAEEEGIAVAEFLAGMPRPSKIHLIPSVIYTFPEVASVGQSEEELKANSKSYRVGKFPFIANGRAKANEETDGFVKVLADAQSDRILGVHIIGTAASELIAEAAIAMDVGATSETLALACHAHPTLSEAMKEAAMAVSNRAIFDALIS